jgi:hypothetical protein
MLHVNVLVQLVRASRIHFGNHRPIPVPKPSPRRLFLEPLEARTCPSDITVNATVTGFWDQFGKHIERTQSYETGVDGRYNYHSFYVFDLTDVGGTITGATLVLENPASGFNSNSSPLTLGFVNVDTPIDQLIMRADRTNPRVDIWQDLGGMKLDNEDYGTYDATSADNGTLVSIPLTDAAIADLNAAEGQSFAIGASITNLNGTDNPQEMFGDSRAPRLVRQLVVTIANDGPQIPNRPTGPATSALPPEDFNALHGDPGSPLAPASLFNAFPPPAPAGTAGADLLAQRLNAASGERSSPSSSRADRSLALSGFRHDAQDVRADGLTDGLSRDQVSLQEANAGVR